jgi:hypothetical protein
MISQSRHSKLQHESLVYIEDFIIKLIGKGSFEHLFEVRELVLWKFRGGVFFAELSTKVLKLRMLLF